MWFKLSWRFFSFRFGLQVVCVCGFFVYLPVSYDVILYLYKEYWNYNNSFVRKRSDPCMLPPTRECGIFGILDILMSFKITVVLYF